MKNTLIALIGLALCAGVTHAQTTNAAPIATDVTVVVAPAAQTTVSYRPGTYKLDAAATTGLVNYLASIGVAMPAGAVASRVMLTVYADGTSHVMAVPSDPAKRMPVPVGKP